MTAYPVRIAMIAALGGFLFGFETAVISGAEKTIQELWGLSGFWQGFTVASSLNSVGLSYCRCSCPALREKKSFAGHRYSLPAVGHWMRHCSRMDIVYNIPFYWRHCGRRVVSGWSDVYF